MFIASAFGGDSVVKESLALCTVESKIPVYLFFSVFFFFFRVVNTFPEVGILP